MMNIQLFGTKKCNNSKKAERYFKERGIKFQYIDMREKGLSKGELQSVMSAVGGIDNLINPNCKDQEIIALISYLVDYQKFDKLLNNQQIINTPVVRNGKQATVGYRPEIWKTWE